MLYLSFLKCHRKELKEVQISFLLPLKQNWPKKNRKKSQLAVRIELHLFALACRSTTIVLPWLWNRFLYFEMNTNSTSVYDWTGFSLAEKFIIASAFEERVHEDEGWPDHHKIGEAIIDKENGEGKILISISVSNSLKSFLNWCLHSCYFLKIIKKYERYQ